MCTHPSLVWLFAMGSLGTNITVPSCPMRKPTKPLVPLFGPLTLVLNKPLRAATARFQGIGIRLPYCRRLALMLH